MGSWVSLLTERIHTCNPAFEAEFQHWLWPSGTCFFAERLWWGKQKQRIALHEGVDLACFIDQQGKQCTVAPGLLIPVIFPGRVVQLHRDFLNWSIFIRHDSFCRTRGERAVLHTVYGHVQPKEGLFIGQHVRAGTPVSVLEAYPRSTVPLHLHFTVAWIPNDFPRPSSTGRP